MFVNVLTENTLGREFYERIGAAVIDGSEEGEVIAGKPYLQVKYVWAELGC